ncbi:MAG: ATP-binding protein [Lachnospiraceae bacterium]|nr:ATP-binding protein [Lachnospiraceae bacterium]
MTGYRDFMGREEEGLPFRNREEEINVHLGWVDLLLFSYGYVREAKEQDGEDPEQILWEAGKEVRKGLAYLRCRQQASLSSGYPGGEYGISALTEEFGLKEFGLVAFLLALAPQLDEQYLVLYHACNGEGDGGRGLTIALLRRLYELLLGKEEEKEAYHLTRGSEISTCPLFSILHSPGEDSFLMDRLSLQKEIAVLLKGELSPDRELCSICLQEEDFPATEPISAGKEAKDLGRILGEAPTPGCKQLIHLTGRKGSGKKFLVAHACGDKQPCYIDLTRLKQMEGKKAGELFQRILLRCRCLHRLPVLCEADLSGQWTGELSVLLQDAFELVERVVLTSREKNHLHRLAETYDYYHLPIPECKGKERLAIWKHYMQGIATDEEVSLKVLAGTYRFTPGTIVNCIRQAELMATAEGARVLRQAHLRQAASHFNSSRLSGLATYIPPAFSWEDLVIAPRQKQIMQLACARAGLRSLVDEDWGFEQKIRYGRGISLLMYGPPGTGKTMAAQIMAKEIGMELYRVDLSQLVDKYIGETQKNIGRVFEYASEGNFILFFDEADALFSKRTEVQNSNDRHANTEVNYLLQKMEEYEGITILATNRFDHFDSAFVRRITYTVPLEKPGEEERLQLFKTILPPQAKREEEPDFAFFAKQFELTGSNIKAVLYNAAFMAAAEGRGITNADIARAIKYESTKLGKMVMAAEFGPYASFVQ